MNVATTFPPWEEEALWRADNWHAGMFSLAQSRDVEPHTTIHILHQPGIRETDRQFLKVFGRSVAPGEDFNALWETDPEGVARIMFPRPLCETADWCIRDEISRDALFCGQCLDLYEQKVPLVLRDLPYDDYLRTKHWASKRQQALEHYGDTCVLCGSDPVQVHHRTYERRGAEEITDLIVLCDECHARFHRRAS